MPQCIIRYSLHLLPYNKDYNQFPYSDCQYLFFFCRGATTSGREQSFEGSQNMQGLHGQGSEHSLSSVWPPNLLWQLFSEGSQLSALSNLNQRYSQDVPVIRRNKNWSHDQPAPFTFGQFNFDIFLLFTLYFRYEASLIWT